MSSTTRIQFSDCFLYLYTSLINDDCDRNQIQEKRERLFSHDSQSVLYMILLCKELRVHACSNTALYPQGLVQTTLILSAGITQQCQRNMKSQYFDKTREWGTKRSGPFCSGQLGPGLNGQECLFIIILSTLTVHQVRGGDRGLD